MISLQPSIGHGSAYVNPTRRELVLWLSVLEGPETRFQMPSFLHNRQSNNCSEHGEQRHARLHERDEISYALASTTVNAPAGEKRQSLRSSWPVLRALRRLILRN